MKIPICSFQNLICLSFDLKILWWAFIQALLRWEESILTQKKFIRVKIHRLWRLSPKINSKDFKSKMLMTNQPDQRTSLKLAQCQRIQCSHISLSRCLIWSKILPLAVKLLRRKLRSVNNKVQWLLDKAVRHQVRLITSLTMFQPLEF